MKTITEALKILSMTVLTALFFGVQVFVLAHIVSDRSNKSPKVATTLSQKDIVLDPDAIQKVQKEAKFRY